MSFGRRGSEVDSVSESELERTKRERDWRERCTRSARNSVGGANMKIMDGTIMPFRCLVLRLVCLG